MRRQTSLALACTLALLAAAPAGDAAGGKPSRPSFSPEREILLPLEDLDIVLESGTRRVLMSRKEYEALRRKARQVEDLRPPIGAALTSADYSVEVRQERAVIRGTLGLDVVEEGLQMLPLSLSGVGLLDAQLDGSGAQLGRDPKRRLQLFVEGLGRHELAIEATTVLQTTAARQVLDFELPVPPSTRLRVTVPGDVEIRSGASVVSRSYDEKADETRLELLARPGRMSLVMTLNSRLKRQERVVMARSVFVDEVTQAYERLHATVSLDVLHRAVRDFRFRVPDGFEVTTVESPALSRWLIRNEGQDRVLEVQLREDMTDAVVVSISAVRPSPDFDDWKLARFEPLEVVGHVAVAGLLLEERLKAHEVAPTGLIPIDGSVLLRALPKTVVQPDAGEARVRPLVVYYAPQPDFGLSARFARQPARFAVTTSLLLTLQDSGMNAQGGFGLSAREEALFAFDFTVPAEWRVEAVTDPAGVAQGFERYAGDDGRDRIRVRLGKPVPAGEEKTIQFTALHEPAGWFDDWQRRDVALPTFAVQDAERDIGAIAIDVLDDLRARPSELKALTPLDENEKKRYGLSASAGALAYRYESHPYTATLELTRNVPRLTAETYSFLRIERDVLSAHYELIYDVTEARARRTQLSLPASTPAVLSIRGLGGTQLKEFTHETDAEGRRVWTASLVDAQDAPVHLAVDFQMPTGKADTFAVPLVRAEGVAYQSGLVAVEGSAELDVQVVEHPRRVDIGELAAAEYQPGRRLLGAYGFIGEPAAVQVAVRERDAYQLPPAIVKRAELTTRFSDDGTSLSSALFHLRTKASYVDIELPEQSVLWSAMLNGKPARPQQKDERILFGLPAGKLDADLQLVYETPVGTVRAWNRLDISAPQLFLHEEEDGPRRSVPMTDLVWDVDTPTGFQVVSSAGTVVSGGVRPTPPAAVSLARWLYAASGGISPRRGLLGGCVSVLSLSAVRARKMAAMESSYDNVQMAEAPAAREENESGFLMGEAVDNYGGRSSSVTQRKLRKGAKGKTQKKLPSWAVEGARSLQIKLAKSGRGITFRSLGEAPRLAVTLISRRRIESLAWAVALATFLLGTLFTGAPLKRRAAFVVTVLLVSTVLPAIPGLKGLALVLNAAFYAAFALIPYYVFASLVRAIARTRAIALGNRQKAIATVALLLAVASWSATGRARGAEAASDDRYVVELEPARPVKVPDSAIIVPYGDDARETDRIMVPYGRFSELWRLAHPPTNGAARPAAAYSLQGVAYSGTLENDDVLVLRGTLGVSVHVDEHVAVPLPLTGAALASASVDNRPARLGTEPVPQVRQQAKRGKGSWPTDPAAGRSVLYLRGKGHHEVALVVRVRLKRQGGWRVAQAQLPVAPAAALAIRVPQAGTEVTLAGIADRPSYRTGVDNEQVRAAMNADGRLDLRWRPRVSEGQVDRTLTATSTAVFDLQEDHLRLVWAFELRFRRGEYEQFRVELPPEYLVERVTGTNVRGWQIEDGGETGRRLMVRLLQRAKERETFSVNLWRPGRVAAEGSEHIAVPQLAVPSAIRHTGRVTIRRSPLLDLRTATASGVRRTDLAPAEKGLPEGGLQDRSPLGIQPYQSYDFMSLPFDLGLLAETASADVRASVQSILRVAERERSIESRVNLSVKGRPILQTQIRVPDELEITGINAPGTFEWAETDTKDGRLVTLYFAAGIKGNIPIVISGRLGAARELTELVIPRLDLPGVEEQPGDLVVQADPAFDVQARALNGIESVLLRRVHGWLQPAQRPFARLALHYDRPEYSGKLVLVPRKADVSSYTVTNVRVTDRAVEETILIDFSIRNAGLRQVAFTLPALLADARISAPLLRQKTVTPEPNGERVRVVLELQDEVMNQLRVLVESDRLLTGDAQTIRLPQVLTGRAPRRYLAQETAGRDEVMLDQVVAMEVLNREQKEWARVAGLLRGGTTRAFVAAADAEEPTLTFRTRQRATVETAGAGIGLARTLVIMDPTGTYRASQTYRVDNRTEQFLDVLLPAGAELWTARVAGEYVKPVIPEDGQTGRTRIPLVKTAVGDLDYEVALKYGGRVEALRRFGRMDIPLIRTQNINVELSQVELRLPKTHRWLDFDGTMRRVAQAGDFEAGMMAYKNKLTQRLVHTLKYGNPFAQARATSNLRQLTKALESDQRNMQSFSYNPNINVEISNASGIIDTANKELADFEKEIEDDADGLDNRWELNDAFDNQVNTFARNVVLNNGANWAPSAVQQDGQLTTAGVFNGTWLAGNNLMVVDSKTVTAAGRIQAQGGGQAIVQELGEQQQTAQAEQQFEFFSNVGRAANLPDAQMPQQPSQQAAVQLPPAQRRNNEARGKRWRSQKALAAQYQQKLALQQGQQLQQTDMTVLPSEAGMPQPTAEPAKPGTAAIVPQTVNDIAGMPLSVMADGGVTVVSGGFGGGGEALGLGDRGDAATGLASLDVDLPGPDEKRWAAYQFSTPRGEIAITAMAVADEAIDAYQRGGLALALLVLAAVVRLLGRRRTGRPSRSRGAAGTALIITGVLCVFIGILPVAGILAVVVGIVLRRIHRRQVAAVAVAG
jgi:hypothetical protein